MSTAVARMSRMLDDLSEISRTDSQPSTREPRPVRLTELLENSLAHAAPAAAVAGVRLDVDLADDLEVMGIPDDLARVLDNLLSNAVRSSGTGGVVRVAGRIVDGEARIAVADTCGGIPSEELSRVFDEGWQGSPHGGRGSDGLGLAIVDQVVTEHGGRVVVEPTLEGCLFEVSLPGPATTTSA
jgi:signal transduction histidine kinase